MILMMDRPLPPFTYTVSRHGLPPHKMAAALDVPENPEGGIYVYISMNVNTLAS